MRNFVFPKNYTLASMALLAILFFIIIGGTVYHQILEQKLSKIMVEKSVCDKALQSLFLSHLYLEERLNNELPHTSIAYMKHLNNFKNNVEKLKKTEHHLFPHNFNELVNNFISITHKRTQNNTKSVELEYHRAFLKLEGAINGHNIALSDIFAKSMQYEYKVALAGLILTLIVLLIVFTILFRVIFVSGQAEGEVFRLKSIIENTPDFVAMADVNGNTLYVNPAGRAMMGFGSEEDLSKYKIADYHSRTMAENIHRICIPAAIQKGVWKGDTKFKSSNGEEISTSQVLIAHKDKMGKPIYFSTIARNVEKEKADTQEIVHHEQLEKLVADVSKNFAMTDLFSVDAYIQNSLSSLGRFSHADRAIIFWLSDDGKVLNNTDEWCAPGVSSEKSKLQNIDFSQYPWFGQHMLQNKPVIVNDVANLSEEAAHEKAEWQQEHIKSLLAVPLAHNNEFTGFLGVVNVIKEREWQDDDVDLLSTLGSVLLQAKMMQSSPDMNEFQISKKTKLLTQTIAAIASTIEKRDPYTAGHQLRVAELSVKIAKKL
nr:PAS domain S-box protein [Gammaproteobacteria bacterium]